MGAALQKGIGKYLRIENPQMTKSGAVRWTAAPGAERLELWSLGRADVKGETGVAETLHLFHIAHNNSVTRFSRVTFMGQLFRIMKVSQASRLHGMELQCEAIRDLPLAS